MSHALKAVALSVSLLTLIMSAQAGGAIFDTCQDNSDSFCQALEKMEPMEQI